MTDTLEMMTVSRLAEHGGVSADTVRYGQADELLAARLEQLDDPALSARPDVEEDR